MLDIIAWLVLGALWIFGGAAFFDSHRTEYKNVLLGWAALNGLVIVVTLFSLLAFWALVRIAT